MKVQPVGECLLVKLEPVQAKKTKFGIDLPDKHAELTRIGIIEAIGEKVTKFEVGDKIMLRYITGDPIILYELGWIDDTHRILTESEVPAKIICYKRKWWKFWAKKTKD